MKNYIEGWELETITEEEFIFDSLRNRRFFDVFKNAELHMLHCVNEGFSLWNTISRIDHEKTLKTSVDDNEDIANFPITNDNTLPMIN